MSQGRFGGTEQHFAQVVLNQGSTTSFSLYNPGTDTIDVDVQLYFPNGDPLANQQVELGPGETESVSFGEAGGVLTRGWAKLTSEGEFLATAFFQLSIGGQLKPRIGVLPSAPAEESRVFGFVNDQVKSGLALHNPWAGTTEVTFRLTGQADQVGQQALQLLDETSLMLDPLQSIAAFLNEDPLFGTGLSGYEGTVEVSASPFPVALLSLTQEASGDVATVSVETSRHYWSETTSGSPNVIAGKSDNFVGPGVVRATVGGGGSAPNSVTNDYGTVGGGRGNTAAGFQSTVSGGDSNTAGGANATVAGGNINTANSSSSTVGGGLVNSASGSYSTVPGGRDNSAAGAYSFAAGRRAKTTGAGSFLFADSTDVDFSRGFPDEFAARASGGVSFFTSSDLSTGAQLLSGSSTWTVLSAREAKENFSEVNGREVLEKVVRFPIHTWNYKAQEDEIRHRGPAAQDFYAAFRLGPDNRHITTVDSDGVALAAIQGLY